MSAPGNADPKRVSRAGLCVLAVGVFLLQKGIGALTDWFAPEGNL